MFYRLRYSRLRWAPLALLLFIAYNYVNSSMKNAERQAEKYGPTESVFVAKKEIRIGNQVRKSDISKRQIPKIFLSENMVPFDPVGQTARIDIEKSQILSKTLLAPVGLKGPAALLPTGKQAVAIDNQNSSSLFEIGDRVNIVSTPSIDGLLPETLAQRATVIGKDAANLVVAVDPDQVSIVGNALNNGGVLLVLTN